LGSKSEGQKVRLVLCVQVVSRFPVNPWTKTILRFAQHHLPATDRGFALTLELGRRVLLVFADRRGQLLKAARWPQPYLRLEKLLVVSCCKAIYLSAPLSEHIGFVNAGSSFSYPTNQSLRDPASLARYHLNIFLYSSWNLCAF
jgi:hypothetical protein